MFKRIILLVLDGVGVGALPDAARYGDSEASTLTHLAEVTGGLALPNLESLGLGHIVSVKGVRTMAQPNGCFGRMGFTGSGKDALLGNWELAGVAVAGVPRRYRDGIPPEDLANIERVLGRTVIGRGTGTMDEMLASYGAEHRSGGGPIVWVNSDCTCHVAAHEAVYKPADLAQRCREIRKALKRSDAPVRVVAHCFSGDAPPYRITGRTDAASEPPGVTMLDLLSRAGQIIMGVGQAAELFSGRGFTRSIPALSATQALTETFDMLSTVPRGLLYATVGPLPQEPNEAASVLQAFDRRLPDLFDRLRAGDAVFMTADHGRDVTRPSKPATREYVPLLVTGPKLAQGVNLGTRVTAADVGQTIVEALKGERLPAGESFLEALRPG